jgi:hypothetical protein
MTIEVVTREEAETRAELSSSETRDDQLAVEGEDMFKKIRIHSGVVSRLLKDYSYYVAESERVLEQVEQMKVC